MTVHIIGRICFGITQVLSLFEYIRKFCILLIHFRENIISRTIHNTKNTLYVIRGQGTIQSINNWYATTGRSFEIKVYFISMR